MIPAPRSAPYPLMVADECLHDGGPGPLVLFFMINADMPRLGKKNA